MLLAPWKEGEGQEGACYHPTIKREAGDERAILEREEATYANIQPRHSSLPGFGARAKLPETCHP